VSILGVGREPPLVVLHPDLLDVSRRQVLNSPRLETGGKFLGYVVPSAAKVPKSAYGNQVADRWRRIAGEVARGRNCLFLVGSISPGPLAQSTATSLLPDGQFQAAVFQALERSEPELEHLGTWHSHHPNGLSEFSGGDVQHYESVIVDRDYGPDHFVAGLCVDQRGLGNGRFELFSRKGARRVRLTAEQIVIDGGFPSLQPVVERVEAEVRAGEPPSPLDAALETAFVIRERRQDSDSTSWVVQARSGPDFLGVVTRTRGPQPHVALSINMSTPEISVQYDASSVENRTGVRKLTSDLLRVVNDLEEAVRRSSRRS
jgi:hypothetical protein